MSAETKQPTSQTAAAVEAPAEWALTPLWLIVLFSVSVFWGMLYLSNHGGGFHTAVYAPYTNTNDLYAAWPMDVDGQMIHDGKLVYGRTCIACHQAAGTGTPGQFPPLAGSDWIAQQSPTRIIRIVLNGAQGHIMVNGTEFNNTMVPWKDALKDYDIAAVLTYVRQEWGNKAPAVTEAQVKAIREKMAGQNAAMNPDDLMKIPEGQ